MCTAGSVTVKRNMGACQCLCNLIKSIWAVGCSAAEHTWGQQGSWKRFSACMWCASAGCIERLLRFFFLFWCNMQIARCTCGGSSCSFVEVTLRKTMNRALFPMGSAVGEWTDERALRQSTLTTVKVEKVVVYKSGPLTLWWTGQQHGDQLIRVEEVTEIRTQN